MKLGIVFIITVFLAMPLFAQKTCSDVVSSEMGDLTSKAGALFLHQQNKEFHFTKDVNESAIKYGLSENSDPVLKIQIWLKKIGSYLENPIGRYKFKKLYFGKNIIKEMPEAYINNLYKMFREMGYGDLKLPPERVKILSESLTEDQNTSFNVWFEYIFSSETNMYPVWLKYWVLSGVVKLGGYDKVNGKFTRRTHSTVRYFVELNPEALHMVMSEVLNFVRSGRLSKGALPNLEGQIISRNFGKIYGFILKNKFVKKLEDPNIEGRWVKYNEGTSYMPLVKSLAGRCSGWCTVVSSTASYQLEGGSFYIYYSKGSMGAAEHPRIIIFMKNQKIVDIKGVSAKQELEGVIADSSILADKLKELGYIGDEYTKKVSDMTRMTAIDNKVKSGIELSKEELIFLYELDSRIMGGADYDDPRIKEIISTRDVKADLSRALNIHRSKISVYPEVILNGKIDFHLGDLDLNKYKTLRGMKLPKVVSGNVLLDGLTFISGLDLPEYVRGNVFLKSIDFEEVRYIELPYSDDGFLYLKSNVEIKLQSKKNN